VILIRTPPLRTRKGDVRLLAENFLKKFNQKITKSITGFDEEAMRAIEQYSWPGNVRELENCIERAVTLESTSLIQFSSLPVGVQKAQASLGSAKESSTTGSVSLARGEIHLPAPDFVKGNLNLDEILGQVEKTYLLAALQFAGGVKKKAADLLGITFRSMRYRLKKLGVDVGDDES
jgi:two-component system response regulator PilR (NtrC family)